MDANNDLLPLLKLELELKYPDLDVCWLEGYEASSQECDLDDNPYPQDSKEADYWLQGWWSGFYEEPILDPKPKAVVNEATFTRTFVTQATNEENWLQEPKARWYKFYKLVSVILFLALASTIVIQLTN